MSLLDLLTISLATLYAAYALTKTSGPFHVFTTVREKLPLGGLTTCITCAAFWLSLLMVVAWSLHWTIVVQVFAAAGAALALAQYVGLKQE